MCLRRGGGETVTIPGLLVATLGPQVPSLLQTSLLAQLGSWRLTHIRLHSRVLTHTAAGHAEPQASCSGDGKVPLQPAQATEKSGMAAQSWGGGVRDRGRAPASPNLPGKEASPSLAQDPI